MKSFKLEIDGKELAVIELLDEVGSQLHDAQAKFAENAKGKQQDIAARLGLDKSRVSRMLSGFSNLTLKSLAELCWALDAKVSVSVQSTLDATNDEVTDTAPNATNLAAIEKIVNAAAQHPKPSTATRLIYPMHTPHDAAGGRPNVLVYSNQGVAIKGLALYHGGGVPEMLDDTQGEYDDDWTYPATSSAAAVDKTTQQAVLISEGT